MNTKAFHITEIISVITGKMVATSHMDGIHPFLEFMCGEPIFTHQIPRAVRECSPYLLKQFPMLADEKAEGITKETLQAWAANMEAKYGKMLAVEPLPEGAHFRADPISELESMKNPSRH
ncbi:MAG: hypothetical protein DI582_02725 [Azospirillum brasilense]|nr:MAG: hypothetical protein DI582_02725 [Azospirillum brasilense]